MRKLTLCPCGMSGRTSRKSGYGSVKSESHPGKWFNFVVRKGKVIHRQYDMRIGMVDCQGKKEELCSQ